MNGFQHNKCRSNYSLITNILYPPYNCFIKYIAFSYTEKVGVVIICILVCYWHFSKVQNSLLSAADLHLTAFKNLLICITCKNKLKGCLVADAGSITFTLRLLLGRMAIPSFHSRTWTMLQGPPTCAVSVGGTTSLALPPLAGSPTATAGVTSIWWWPGVGADRKTCSQTHRPSSQMCMCLIFPRCLVASNNRTTNWQLKILPVWILSKSIWHSV